MQPWYSVLYIKSTIVKILLGILSVVVAIVVILGLGLIEEQRMAAQTGNWQGRSIEKGADIFANNCATCHGQNGQGNPGPALNSKYFFTQRLEDVDYTGSLENYVKLTVAAGRPSKAQSEQWSVVMATWGAEYGGPLRGDQVQDVTDYILNWEEAALEQTDEEDPWIPFQDTPPSDAEGEDEGQETSTGEAAEGDEAEPRAPQEIFTQMGCQGCHELEADQTDANRGPVGPNMGNLADHAGSRVEGQNAEEYVRNSIVNPNEHIVDGYQANIMPQGLADDMTDEELDALVTWLLDPERGQ